MFLHPIICVGPSLHLHDLEGKLHKCYELNTYRTSREVVRCSLSAVALKLGFYHIAKALQMQAGELQIHIQIQLPDALPGKAFPHCNLQGRSLMLLRERLEDSQEHTTKAGRVWNFLGEPPRDCKGRQSFWEIAKQLLGTEPKSCFVTCLATCRTVYMVSRIYSSGLKIGPKMAVQQLLMVVNLFGILQSMTHCCYG